MNFYENDLRGHYISPFILKYFFLEIFCLFEIYSHQNYKLILILFRCKFLWNGYFYAMGDFVFFINLSLSFFLRYIFFLFFFFSLFISLSLSLSLSLLSSFLSPSLSLSLSLSLSYSPLFFSFSPNFLILLSYYIFYFTLKLK